MTSLVGITGNAIGHDPFDIRNWSGSSYYFFSELQKQGLLRRAIGVEVSTAAYLFHLAQSFYPQKTKWRNRLSLNIDYRNALTRKLSTQFAPEDSGCDVLQIGGYFDGTVCATSGARSFAYYDGNLTSRVKSGYSLGASDAAIRRAIDYETELLSRMTAVFTFSEYLRASFIEDYNLPGHKVINIGGGVNISAFPEVKRNKNYQTNEIIFIGKDFKRKGGHSVVKAFEAVKKAVPSAKLHIVGPKTNPINDQIDGIQFHGFLSKSDPSFQELFNRASLFVMPSLFEPFGIAPLEAMANCIPAVVTDEWAFREMVKPGTHGALVKRDSPLELGEKIIELLGDPDKLEQMGIEGRRHVLENYTWRRVVQRLNVATGPEAGRVE